MTGRGSRRAGRAKGHVTAVAGTKGRETRRADAQPRADETAKRRDALRGRLERGHAHRLQARRVFVDGDLESAARSGLESPTTMTANCAKRTTTINLSLRVPHARKQGRARDVRARIKQSRPDTTERVYFLLFTESSEQRSSRAAEKIGRRL